MSKISVIFLCLACSVAGGVIHRFVIQSAPATCAREISDAEKKFWEGKVVDSKPKGY
jgi:hypothetical protein